MLALERRNLILEKLQAEERVVVSELSQLFMMSLKRPYAVIWTSWKKRDLPQRVMAVR